MKKLYARLVLWLIRPSLNLSEERQAECARRLMAEFQQANPPSPLAPELFT